jgi:hypothetical protein
LRYNRGQPLYIMASPTVSAYRLTPSASSNNLPQDKSAKPARFAGLPDNAIQQFFADTAGVYAPKLPYMRSWLQFFEDSFLEGVEDAAWYFIIPGLGPYIGKAFNQLAKTGIHAKDATDLIGKPLHSLKLDHLPADKAARLIGAKAATVTSAAALMCGAEYLVQHNKNWVTAKLFGTKNFAAVAGLEQSSNDVKKGEEDPTTKAALRNKQVLMGVLSALGASVVMAKGLPRSARLTQAAKNVLNWVDFGKGFDVSKSLLALGIGTGVVSYMDAARDNLERKELASRLAIVVPYLMFGKELAGNFVAWVRQGGNELAKAFGIGDVELPDGKKVAIKDLKGADGKAFSFLQPDFNILKTPFQKESFLNFNAVKSLETITKEVNKLDLPEVSKARLLRSFSGIDHNKFLLCTAVMSGWLAILVNAQTRNRYKRHHPDTQPQLGSHRAKLYGSNPFQSFQAANAS